MLDNLLFCLNATIPIFAIILLGRLLRGLHFFTPSTLSEIDRLVFKVLLPVLLFRDISSGRITEQFDARFFLFCAGTTTLYFLVIWFGAAKLLPDKNMVGAFTQGAFRGSQAVLGVAFVQSLYGEVGLVPLMIVATVPLYNVYSVLVLAVTAPQNSQTQQEGVLARTLRGIVTNPIILGILAGLPFSLMQVDFPPMLSKGLDMLSGCATPLALLSIGAGFEGRKAIQKLGPTCAATFIKLIGLPVVFLPIAAWLGFREQAMVALVILYGAPATVTGYVMAKNMGGDHVLSSSIIVLSTALSAVTLTVILFLLRTAGLI
ncbi:MAG: AEC family transporter [Agathobaculum sp.]|jgi:predicted permease|uniref:AEC family transporter n=1 Tax=Agathobaculum sp. TaxID=2048138 RepID=UPI003D8A82C5